MTPAAIAALLTPYAAVSPELAAQLALYLDLILKWNARMNLTSIRTPEEIVQRHFGESLFAGYRLGKCLNLLDFGSGAGFPGLPIQLLHPNLDVTLAESRTKKASFLREAIRTLNLPTQIWPNRVEAMPAERRFDAVALRAVDTMEAAVREAARHASRRLLILGTKKSTYPFLSSDFEVISQFSLPESQDGTLLILDRR